MSWPARPRRPPPAPPVSAATVRWKRPGPCSRPRRSAACRRRWQPPSARASCAARPGWRAKPKGGIPWNDSPKMPAPVPFQLPPNPLAGPAPAPARHGRQHAPGRPRRRPRDRPAARRQAPAGRSPARTAAGPFRPASLFAARAARASAQPPRGRRRRVAAAHDVHGGLDRGSTRRGAARAPHSDPPRRHRRRLASDPRRRQPDRPRPGAAVRRRRLPVAASRRALGRPERRDRFATSRA